MDQKILRKYIQNERKTIRTIAANTGDIYVRFKTKCRDMHMTIIDGLKEAIRDWLKKYSHD